MSVVSDLAKESGGLILAPRPPPPLQLLNDFGDAPGADRAATLPDREPQTLVHGDRLDQLDLHLDVVAGHDHLGAVGQVGDAGDVGRAEVELRPITGEERGVTPALLLLEDVDLGLELGVRRDRAGLAQHLAALDVLTLGPSQKAAGVVARAALVEVLLEHLHARDNGRGGRLDTDDLDSLTDLDDGALDGG